MNRRAHSKFQTENEAILHIEQLRQCAESGSVRSRRVTPGSCVDGLGCAIETIARISDVYSLTSLAYS